MFGQLTKGVHEGRLNSLQLDNHKVHTRYHSHLLLSMLQGTQVSQDVTLQDSKNPQPSLLNRPLQVPRAFIINDIDCHLI